MKEKKFDLLLYLIPVIILQILCGSLPILDGGVYNKLTWMAYIAFDGYLGVRLLLQTLFPKQFSKRIFDVYIHHWFTLLTFIASPFIIFTLVGLILSVPR